MNWLKSALFSCITLSSITTCISQDSLVYLSDISYTGESEKQAFNSYFKDKKPDFFLLFNQPEKKAYSEVKVQFYNFLDGLNYEDKAREKKADKKVKYVYDNVHQRFLSKYESIILFPDLFVNGEYNCVSATALYCMAFDYFKIPYTIKEEPTHVYPVAFPKSHQIIVETTNPQVGSYAFTQQFKQTYLERLRDQKLISVSEFAQTGINDLFNKYFFKSQVDITLDQLVGIQYMNDGIFKIEQNDNLGAAIQMEKAYLFYPSERIANSLFIASLRAFQERKQKDDKHAILLAKLSRFRQYGVTPEMIQSDFNSVINELVFNSGKVDQCKSYYSVLGNYVKDSTVRDNIDFLYNYEVGRYYYNKGSYNAARPFFEKALLVKPNQQETQSIYISLLEKNLKTITDHKEVLTLLNYVNDTYPELQTNNNFNAMVASSYLMEFAMAYEENDVPTGEKFKALFETQITRFPDMQVNPYHIGQAYSTAAVYYFKKNQSSKSKIYLKKGLEYAPGNRELLQRQKMIN